MENRKKIYKGIGQQVNVGDKGGARSIAFRIKLLSKTQGKHIRE